MQLISGLCADLEEASGASKAGENVNVKLATKSKIASPARITRVRQRPQVKCLYLTQHHHVPGGRDDVVFSFSSACDHVHGCLAHPHPLTQQPLRCLSSNYPKSL